MLKNNKKNDSFVFNSQLILIFLHILNVSIEKSSHTETILQPFFFFLQLHHQRHPHPLFHQQQQQKLLLPSSPSSFLPFNNIFVLYI